jgi:hypothetical protein
MGQGLQGCAMGYEPSLAQSAVLKWNCRVMLKEIGRLQRLANFAAGDKVVHKCFALIW